LSAIASNAALSPAVMGCQPLGTCAVLVIDPYLECSTLNRTG
jgi:hypothetical protein